MLGVHAECRIFVEGEGQTVCTDAANETTCTRGRRFFFNSYDVGASSTETEPGGRRNELGDDKRAARGLWRRRSSKQRRR
jgi:hypothetical protein